MSLGPLVERESAVPYDADSEPDDDHRTNDDYTTQSCPLRYSFCLCQTQIDEICATCVNRPGKRCERFGGKHGFDYGPDFNSVKVNALAQLVQRNSNIPMTR